MRRPTVNLIVDLLAFSAFVFLTTSGVLLRYVLPPGSGRFTTLWGLGRHDWGAVHFWIAVVFLALLALHLVLHGRWLLATVRGRASQGARLRLALAIVGALALLALAVAPLVSPIERVQRPGGRGSDDGPRREGGGGAGHGPPWAEEQRQRRGD